MSQLLNYVTSGDAVRQPLLILHGLFGSHKNWNRIANELSSDYYVIAIDLRNHGDSFHHSEMTYAVMAEDVYFLIKQLKINNVIMMGHSMGGKIAMTLANNHPQVLKQLVIVDIAPIPYAHNHNDLIDPILNTNINAFSNRKDIDLHLKNSIPEDFIRLFLLQSLAKNAQGWYWKNAWQTIKDNMSNIIAAVTFDDKITTPTLFIFGSNSSYFNEQAKSSIEINFTDFIICIVEEADHWLHYQKPQQFLTLLTKNLL